MSRAVGALSMLAAVAILQALIAAGWVDRYIVPPPTDVIAAFGRILVEEDALPRALFTAGECAVAIVLLTVLGVAGGWLLSRFRLLRRATESWVAAWLSAPVVLAYPLFLVIFGRHPLAIVMVGLAAALPPVILKTVEGLAGTRRVLLNVAASLRLTPAQTFWKIQFPSALPAIFLGLRLGTIYAMINIVGVEFLLNYGGIGALISTFSERYDLSGTYAAILFVVLISVLFFMALERMEQWLRPPQ
jgi:ABC-type nitrate/sulfonate/bicarbonate transport system permease component